MRYAYYIIIIFLLSSCATAGSHTITYQSPSTPEYIDNEVVVNLPYETAWTKLLENLSKSFFVVNNIDKNSGFINVSYLAEDGYPYVDCGKHNIISIRGKRVNEFEFPIAKSNVFEVDEGSFDFFEIYTRVTRETKVEGRINILLLPLTEDSVKFSVNAKYIFSKKGTAQTILKHMNNKNFVQNGNMEVIPPYYINFSTNVEGSAKTGNVMTYCVSTGKLERDILAMLPH